MKETRGKARSVIAFTRDEGGVRSKNAMEVLCRILLADQSCINTFAVVVRDASNSLEYSDTSECDPNGISQSMLIRCSFSPFDVHPIQLSKRVDRNKDIGRLEFFSVP